MDGYFHIIYFKLTQFLRYGFPLFSADIKAITLGCDTLHRKDKTLNIAAQAISNNLGDIFIIVLTDLKMIGFSPVPLAIMPP